LDDNDLDNYNSILINDLKSMNYNLNDDIESIWESLNARLHKKFGYTEEITKSVLPEDLNWACVTLPAYINWNQMKSPTRLLLEFWQRKISNYLKKSSEKGKAKKVRKNETNKVSEAEEADKTGIDEIEDVPEADETDASNLNEAGKYLIKFFIMFFFDIVHLIFLHNNKQK
jgi:hypothetical protein